MKRKRLIGILVVVALVVSLATGLAACKKDDGKITAHKKTSAEIALETAYTKQYRALVQSKSSTKYGRFYIKPEFLNSDGICTPMYIWFAGYHKYTGKTITYQQVIDYLSSEYESDGAIRIYNNGRHPEIADYVEWAWSHQSELDEYEYRLSQLYYGYSHENPGFNTVGLTHWSTATIDELIKKEADPNYQMNLLAIQQQEAAKSTTTPSP